MSCAGRGACTSPVTGVWLPSLDWYWHSVKSEGLVPCSFSLAVLSGSFEE